MTTRLLVGDCRQLLQTLPDASVHCVVTSPPFWGLRDYGTGKWEGGDSACGHAMPRNTNRHRPGDKSSTNQGSNPITWPVCGKCGARRIDDQIGLEASITGYVEQIVGVFREVKRVLRDDGTLWLNLGDSYASGKGSCFNPGGGESSLGKERKEDGAHPLHRGNKSELARDGLKPKDLCGIPWRVAFALQTDGWWLRQDIIWAKPNPMPESVTDRCTKSHEYLFLLTKSARYYFDAEAIAEPVTESTVERLSQPTLDQQRGSDRVPGKTNGPMKAVVKRSKDENAEARNPNSRPHSLSEFEAENGRQYPTRNKRSVWTITTQPFSEAHFATFPPALVEPCIKAGSPLGGMILDPFGGSGTTGLVADRLGRDCVLIELNPAYAEMAKRRIFADAPLFAEVK